MTCKDCVHYEVCSYNCGGCGWKNIDQIEEDHCPHFKNKAEIELEAIDDFKNGIMDRFIDMCRGNDYNKINLLQIGDTIDHIFDLYVKKMIFEKEGADNG